MGEFHCIWGTMGHSEAYIGTRDDAIYQKTSKPHVYCILVGTGHEADSCMSAGFHAEQHSSTGCENNVTFIFWMLQLISHIENVRKWAGLHTAVIRFP